MYAASDGEHGPHAVTLRQRLGVPVRAAVRRGPRTVIWTPESGVGFANCLYLWLHAHSRAQRGEEWRVLTPEAMRPWLALLPTISDQLSLDPIDVRRRDRREWAFFSRFGTDFDERELDAFVRSHLLPSPLLDRAVVDDAVVVNIRRGNYYSAAHFRGTYSFDIRGYLEIALARAEAERGAFERLRVVSDGIEWCRLKLDDLLHRYTDQVDYVGGDRTPQEHFRLVATASRVIGTNSTFSYWGGYVSNVLYGAASHVVMPRFHARLNADPSAYQLNPQWSIVDDIPGGWDA